MFTGIVQTTAQVREIRDEGQLRRLTLTVPPANLQALERGASVAINGVCLTATEFDSHAGWVCFDVIAETLDKTNLGKLAVGSKVNLERSLTFGSELGGHIVSGHIQTTAILTRLTREQHKVSMELSLDTRFLPYILAKGFIAVEGCSLTVGEVTDSGFSLYLIPETLAITTLGDKQEGDIVNIELDQQTLTIIKTVERVMAERFATAKS
ncbi:MULTISPECIES: riboflavin synthase subunit alpha [unclassified Arsukibacterium]|uniref:riboflavin synthase subunit alpha n=1 Tax=unclassified Arsukibacterium TaxID=2635278 RepID=UPI0025C00CE4|nr:MULTISPECIES: riboflavin synthase subunit alpha [unclassified Arsukibacterium]|tara:strand:+ start:20241 stop:20870 length:630 start_codon:yes stop_codon:yes gene_type:complete